jgi:hypothetical protein
MKVTLEIDNIPAGYEATGEFRHPKEGDWFIDVYGDANNAIGPVRGPRVILRKKPPEVRSVFVNVYPGNIGDYGYSSKAEADTAAGRYRIACLELKYEVPFV